MATRATARVARTAHADSMTYNPKIHHRRSIRLKGYDYSRAGAYFITIGTHRMEYRFGNIVGASLADAPFADAPFADAPTDAEMELNEYGQIAYDEWVKLPERFGHVALDVFQIMPNHMHGIIVLKDEDSYGIDSGEDDKKKSKEEGATARVARTAMGGIVGAYKSLVANGCLAIFKSKNEIMGKLWHRNYHEHIIRDEESYQKIRNYIINNPSNWKRDKFF
ncbi:MAG: transposase [Cyclobacteriaceae bacterium]